MELKLKSSFGTSHSSTTTRTNALIITTLETPEKKVFEGYGEVGLPPKKAFCYLANY